MKMHTALQTKRDFQRLLLDILDPLRPHYSKAGLHIGETAACYGPDVVAMEAFLRPLWGLVPYWAGGGAATGLEEGYLRGFAEGPDPDSDEYWGGFRDTDQRFVEMASIAYGLILTPERLWEPLGEEQKERLARWLRAINHYRLPVCNWICFRILVNVALKKRGCAYDADKLAEALEQMDSFYLGDGWYRDGSSDQRDYYISFGLHYYGLLYARFMAEEDPARCRVFRERAMEFARDFIYWFDGDGTALPYGRSLTYRFSQAAFFSACIFAGVHPFPVEVMKGVIVRNLRRWMEKPIFDRAGLLTIGYEYPNLCMAEMYNAPGSPYWALKTFAVLALPDDDPFWSAEAAPLPELETQKLLGQGQMLIHRYPGHTTAYVPGKVCSNNLEHYPEKYGKFAYDTKFAFSVAKSSVRLPEAAPDSMLAFVIDGYVYTRRGCDSFTVTEGEVVSVWRPCSGITVTTRIVPTRRGHRREHTVESSIHCAAYDCGFAVAMDVPGEGFGQTDGSAFAETARSRCEVILREGRGRAEVIGADPNTNLAHARTRIPAVCYEIEPGVNTLCTEILAEYWDR